MLRRPEHPHQAAVFRVRDTAHGAAIRVLKWYDREHAPEPEVWELLRTPHPRLAHLVEADPAGADGHPYDLAPSYGETDLAARSRAEPGPAPVPFVTAVVRQAHEALTTLHGLGVVHRDISPANLVLGSLDPADPELTLVDFGVSAYAPDGRATRGRHWVGTLPYLSPQALIRSQSIHRPADWWSLGMIAAELAGGRHPIRYHGDENIQEEIVSRAPDLRRVTDPRLLVLCRGLLTRDPDHRWGADEVARWLAGELPPVAPPAEGRTAGAAPHGTPERDGLAVEPYAFLGEEFTRPQALAPVFAENWESMRRALRGRRGREEFVRWLGQFDGVAGRDPAERAALTGLLADAPRPATLVRLVSWLGPGLDASYRGHPLDRAGVGELARAALGGDELAGSVVGELREHTLLPLLDHRPGGAGLRRLDRDWVAALSHWESQVENLFAEFPSLRGAEDVVRRLTAVSDHRRAGLLALVAHPAAHRTTLTERAERTLAGLPCPVPWYERLVRDRDGAAHPDAADGTAGGRGTSTGTGRGTGPGTGTGTGRGTGPGRAPSFLPDLVRLALADRLAGLAENESWQERHRADRERAIHRGLLDEDAAARWLRRQDLPPTLGRAVAGALALILPWIFLIGLSDVLGWAPPATVLTAWLLAVPAAAATLAIELLTAYRIGSPAYHPDRSLAGLLVDRALPLARFVRQPGARFPVRGLLLLVPFALLGLAVVHAPWLWPLVTVLALGGWSVRRLHDWHRFTTGLRAGAGAGSGARPGPGPGSTPERERPLPSGRPGNGGGA
ncbi:protein kinase [Streptomyces clavuligerus]|nr:protein kinase [Streptomyces clavuligerus]